MAALSWALSKELIAALDYFFSFFFVCRGARLQRAHERIATKKFYLPLVTRSRGGRRGESGREWSDVS